MRCSGWRHDPTLNQSPHKTRGWEALATLLMQEGSDLPGKLRRSKEVPCHARNPRFCSLRRLRNEPALSGVVAAIVLANTEACADSRQAV